MSAKQGRGRGVAQDEAKLAEVEDGIAAAPDLPEDIAAELRRAELPAAEIGNATRLRNAWLSIRQLEAGWKKAREKADSETKALREARGALETDRAALTERSDQLAARETEIARAELALEEQKSAAKAGFVAELRPMTQEAARRRDEILAEVTQLEDDARVRANAIVASTRQELDAERARLAEEWAELRRQQSILREREAKVEDELTFVQTKESMLAERFERRLETQVADVREQLEEARQILELERQRREAREQELRSLLAELARYGEDPESAKRRNDDLVQQLGALRDELSRRPPAERGRRTSAVGQGSCASAG